MHVAEVVTHDVPSTDAGDARRRRIGRGEEFLLVAGVWLLGQLVFFREQWTSGFDRIMGDPGAARFIIYVNENWYQSLLGHAAWRTPAFYFPIQHTLGLSDTLLLWQVVYTPARALGADPFLAYQLVLVASSALGFATFYLLVRTLWHPPIALRLLGAAVFTFSNALYVNANHPQLFGVLLVPSVCLLGVAAWRAAQRGDPRGALWGAAFGALGVLVAYSTYYVGFFVGLAAVIAAILAVLVAPRATLASCGTALRRGWLVLLGVALGAVLPAILFAVTYLPALHAAGGYKLQSAYFFRASLPDLVNVGVGNLLWGSTLVHGVVHGTAALSERDYAPTPILLVLSLLAAVLASIREHRDAAPPGGRRYSSAVLASTGLLLALAPMAIGSTFLWRAVYWIPGASGIRAVDRITVVASGLLVLALVDAGARLAPWLRAAVPRPALVAGVCALAALLCLEQVNVTNSSQMSRRAQVALLAAPPAPPNACRSFFVETATASAAHPARVQTTAMLLSARYAIPTLNGTSGSFPRGWHLFFPVSGRGYLRHVAHWIDVRHITGTVCALDLDARTWSVFSPSRVRATR
ncbi:MAG TPA: hypothetical protein VGZ03_00600 [Acidimicrobiales bacterium]|nr:hypothetical protein [Acidimicrobiales bacterium]